MSVPPMVAKYIKQVDDALSGVKFLDNFEKQTKVPKVYAVVGTAAFYFLLVTFNVCASFLVDTAGFIIPGYYSLEALFSATPTDDTQWLTYWVVFSCFTIFEKIINPAAWFFKLAFVAWIGLPQFNGANMLFNVAIRPTLAPFFTTAGSSAPRTQDKAHNA